ncbi:UL16-binding protein 2 [Plecturocebus cupreus]
MDRTLEPSAGAPPTVSSGTAQLRASATTLMLCCLCLILPCFLLPGICGESFKVTGTVGRIARGARGRWVRREDREGEFPESHPSPLPGPSHADMRQLNETLCHLLAMTWAALP